MAEVKSARFTKEQENAIADMVERDLADNESEAHRMLITSGMRGYGYTNGEYSETTLKRGVEAAAKSMTIAGMVGLAFTFAYPIAARVPSFAVLAFGVALYVAAQVLADAEPQVSNRIKRYFGGDSA